MARVVEKRPVPPRYEQPEPFTDEWILDQDTEIVDYLPHTHLRIWFNNDKGIYDFHHHTAMEILLCLENQCLILANNEEYYLNVGDILFIPPHMLHKLIFDSFGERFIFLIDTDSLKYYRDYQALDPIFIKPFLCTPSSCPTIYSSVYKDLTQMTDIYFNNNIFTEIQIYSIFLKTVSTIGSHYFSNAYCVEETFSKEKHLEYFEKFTGLLNYIDENCSQEITLEQAAAQMGFSKFHFSRLFKIYTKTTFYNYLCHKRIQKAQSLLSTDASITAIAFQTGFNNSTSFCRCFKKITNCTPSEYRLKLFNENSGAK